MSVKSTISEGTQFGRICRSMIINFPTPMERAASTNSVSLSLSVSARTIRATLAQLTSAKARKILIIPSPRVYIITIARNIDGNASMTSAMRMITASVRPPLYPAIMPSIAPASMEITVGTMPTSSDTREPYSIRVRTSRPASSVPSRCARDGGARRLCRSMLSKV